MTESLATQPWHWLIGASRRSWRWSSSGEFRRIPRTRVALTVRVVSGHGTGVHRRARAYPDPRSTPARLLLLFWSRRVHWSCRPARTQSETPVCLADPHPVAMGTDWVDAGHLYLPPG